AATRTAARDGMCFDFVQVLVADTACGMLAHGFKNADNIEVLALITTRQDGAAINVNGRDIGTQHSHHAARHVFVATANHDHAVHPLTLYTGFDAIGNHFA